MMRTARYQLPGSRDAATGAERLGDSARRDVFEDAPPSPAPLALSAVLKAQTGRLPGQEKRIPSVWETDRHSAEPLNPNVFVRTLRRVDQKINEGLRMEG